uniref:Uncharacterized protein n=1 Tax=Arundo donax TaxID=35708 RepID=A0A0A8ZHW9_ARUDO
MSSVKGELDSRPGNARVQADLKRENADISY